MKPVLALVADPVPGEASKAYLGLGRGQPGPGRWARPTEAVVAVTVVIGPAALEARISDPSAWAPPSYTLSRRR